MPRPRKREPLRTRIFKFRLTDDEWDQLAVQAERAGLTLSEYVRRRVNGHRIVSRVEDHLINELRRLGGLQKHLATQLPSYRPEFNALLRKIEVAITTMSKSFADPLEDD